MTSSGLPRLAAAVLLGAILLAPSAAFADTYDTATLVAITVTKKSELLLLREWKVDVTGRRGDVYEALLTDAQLAAALDAGLKLEVLADRMARDREAFATPGRCSNTPAPCYWTASKFNTVNPPAGSLMAHLLALANTYPTITRLYDIGNSASGNYDIVAMKVTKNPDVVEAEPKLRIYANIHGDEVAGLMIATDVLGTLLAGYPADPTSRKLIDEAELWFVPMGNPDGNAAASRFNGHSIDLNRNFWGPDGNDDGAPFSEPETQAIRDLTEVMGKRFTLSLTFHGGEVCFNSVYNYTSAETTEEPLFFSSRTGGPYGEAQPAPDGLAAAYQAACTTPGFWYTNGADWYITRGDTNDWSWARWSDLDTTLEASSTKWPDSSQIPTIQAQHRQATINYLLEAFQGVSGVMTDASSGVPLDGTVVATTTASSTIAVPHPWQQVYTDPAAGDFHRVLPPGTYTIECRAPGFVDTVVTGVVVTADATTPVNCAMGRTALRFESRAVTADACSGTGGGAGNGVPDPGEEVTLSLALRNPGSVAATGVAATISTTAPGVTILDGAASYPDVAAGAAASSLAPHFRVRLPADATCGTAFPFTFVATSAQGSWSGSFALGAGQTSLGASTTLLAESFDGTTFPPSGWAQTDTSGTAGNWLRGTATQHPSGQPPHSGAGLTWFNSWTASSGAATRLFRTSGFAIPATAGEATLSFWMYHDTADPSADRVQPEVSVNGGVSWLPAGAAVNRNDGSTGWKLHVVDLLPWKGNADLRVALKGISAYGNDCHVDDLLVTWREALCSMNACTPAAARPRPVPDGAFVAGTPVTVAKGAPKSGRTRVAWDVATCPAAGYNLYAGPLAALAASAYDDFSACGLGTSGQAELAIAGDDRFFVIVPVEGSVEGSHGRDGAGAERPGSGVGHCSIGSKDIGGGCP